MPRRRTTRPLLLVLLAATRARAWVPLALDDTRALETALRWAAPAPAGSSSENDGLGGGLTYALEPGFCERLLPNVLDDLFASAGALVRCELLKATVARAFNAWSGNHKSIHFVDAAGAACAPRADGGLEGARAADDGGRCIVPEILVRAPVAGDAGFDGGDFVDDGGGGLAREGMTRAGYTEVMSAGGLGVLKTNGVFDVGGGRIARARISVNTRVCWYLDAPFCFGFAGPPGAAAAAVPPREALVWAWIGAGVLAVGWLGLILYGASWPRRRRAPRAATWLACACVGILLVWPPVFARVVFAPCDECLDFEQMLTHEIGHALGLSHPDEAAAFGRNLRVSPARPLDARGVCRDDLERVERTADLAPSLLLATTQHTAGACPSRDDIEGLHVLYPTCNGSLVDAPRCPAPAARSTGLLRTLWALALALAAAAVFATALTAIVGRLNRGADAAAAARAGGADGAPPQEDAPATAPADAPADAPAERWGFARRATKVGTAEHADVRDATPPLRLLRRGAKADERRSDDHAAQQHARSGLGGYALAKPPPPARAPSDVVVVAVPPTLVLHPSRAPPPQPAVAWWTAALAWGREVPPARSSDSSGAAHGGSALA